MTYAHPRHRKPKLELISNSQKPTVVNSRNPKLFRPKNLDVRPREYLRPDEVEQLITAARSVGRYPLRDGLIILMMYRHGLRVSELVKLAWSSIDWGEANIYIHRLKRGKPSNQPIEGKELRVLRQYQREQASKLRSPWIFTNERCDQLGDEGVRKIVKRAGEVANFDFPIHPHMLRHACGYYLASKGYDTRLIQDYLGHRNINHTVIYTELAPNRFNKLWE